MNRGSGSLEADIAQAKQSREGCSCLAFQSQSGWGQTWAQETGRSEPNATLRPRFRQYLNRPCFFWFFFWSERWVQSPLWGRWAEDKPCRKLPRGHFLFSLLQKKRKKAQQVRVGFPVKSTDGSARIRGPGTEESLLQPDGSWN